MLGEQIMGCLRSMSSRVIGMLHIQTLGSKVLNGRRCLGFMGRRFSYVGFVSKVGRLNLILLTEVTQSILSVGSCLLGVLSEHRIVLAVVKGSKTAAVSSESLALEASTTETARLSEPVGPGAISGGCSDGGCYRCYSKLHVLTQ